MRGFGRLRWGDRAALRALVITLASGSTLVSPVVARADVCTVIVNTEAWEDADDTPGVGVCSLGHAMKAISAPEFRGACPLDDTGGCPEYVVAFAPDVRTITIAGPYAPDSDINDRLLPFPSGAASVKVDGPITLTSTSDLPLTFVGPDQALELQEVTMRGFIMADGSPSPLSGRGGSLSVTDCVFQDNHSPLAGGAIGGTWNGLDITGSQFVDNSVRDGGGGAIALYCAVGDCNPFTITHSVFSGNHAEAMDMDRGTGGGIVVVDANVNISRCTFTSNHAAQVGGAIAVLPGPRSVLNIDNSTFHDNQAETAGGAIFTSAISPDAAPTTLRHVTIVSNLSGIAASFESEYSIESSIILNNGDGTQDCFGEPGAIVSEGGNWLAASSCSDFLSTDLFDMPFDDGDLTFEAPALHGGLTPTIALRAEESCGRIPLGACDAVEADQRGVPRAGDYCVPGAYTMTRTHLDITSEPISYTCGSDAASIRFTVTRSNPGGAANRPSVRLVTPPGFIVDSVVPPVAFDCDTIDDGDHKVVACTAPVMLDLSATFAVAGRFTAGAGEAAQTWTIGQSIEDCDTDPDAGTSVTVTRAACSTMVPPTPPSASRDARGGGACSVEAGRGQSLPAWLLASGLILLSRLLRRRR